MSSDEEDGFLENEAMESGDDDQNSSDDSDDSEDEETNGM